MATHLAGLVEANLAISDHEFAETLPRPQDPGLDSR
jgi:hypothetical protein